MAPRSSYNPTALRDYIKQGKSAAEIMEALAIKNSQTLQSHVMRLMIQDDKVYKVPGLLEKDSATVTVSKSGDLRIPSAVLESVGVKSAKGDKFKVSAKDGVVTLKPE